VYLLDTNIISDIAKNPEGAAARRFAELSNEDLCTSIVVSAEVLFGLANGGSDRLRQVMLKVLGNLTILSMEPPVDRFYAATRSAMSKAGKAIDANDMFIAAHALALDATVVTADQGFRWVPGLKVENWLRSETAGQE
jgi:tRNA(fMet)-specific endonuclease VapC